MLTGIQFPEIFIGIVAPVGVDTQDAVNSAANYFAANGYDVVHIKVTDSYRRLKSQIPPTVDLVSSPYYQRIDSHISYGNQVRSYFDDNGVLAVSAISLIVQHRWRLERESRKSGALPKYEKRVFLINQFKRKEEIDVMRKAYGALFFQLSVFSRRETRIKYISKRIESESDFTKSINTEDLARALVTRDEDEATDPYGQRVGGVFHDADVIINVESASETVEKQVSRFGELLFGSNTISPSKSEYGMYSAKVAALRTLDLSRQVGAAIFTKNGEVVSLGSNEVPKAGGGTYWSDGNGIDAREFVLKVDSNDERKRLVIRELYALIHDGNFTDVQFNAFLAREDVKAARIMDVIEYGRIVHAEMNALTDAARLGRSTQDAILYCTTFPCHICAKHIVASGVEKVVYLEPYPKSLAQELHADSISVDGSERGRFNKYPVVTFEHFAGITPRRYREFFERTKRKKEGKLQNYIDGVKRPVVRIIQPFYIESEKLYVRAGFGALRARA